MNPIDQPERLHEYFELQERGETRWQSILTCKAKAYLPALAEAKEHVKKHVEQDKQLATFIGLRGSGKFRLVFIRKHCQDVPFE